MKERIELTENQKKYFSSMRVCNYDIVSYLDCDTLIDIVCNCLNAYKWAISPLHDKDKNDNGELKKPHYHLVIMFGTKRRGTQLAKLFNTTEIRPINNEAQLKGSFDYLTHDSKNCIGKVKYEKSLLKSNDVEYFLNLDDSLGCDNSFDIIEKMLNNTPVIELVKTYGKDFIYHFNHYRAICSVIVYQKNCSNKLKNAINEQNIACDENGELIQFDFIKNNKEG